MIRLYNIKDNGILDEIEQLRNKLKEKKKAEKAEKVATTTATANALQKAQNIKQKPSPTNQSKSNEKEK